MSKHKYETNFEFILNEEGGGESIGELNPKSVGQANSFLDQDMSEYYQGSGSEKVESILWFIGSPEGGTITVETNVELTSDEQNELSSWIKGQCSDGIGEAFEQQEFAELTTEEGD